MTITFQPAELPSFSRFYTLFWGGEGLSTLRSLEYEALRAKKLHGRILDFGGGDKARYKHLLSYDTYEAVNIDPAMNPTWVTGVGDALPCPMNSYDFVISMNTFEHIYDTISVIHGLFKTLKSGGELVFSVPFLYPVHGHPDDFSRHTASWWGKTLTDAGFTDIQITPHIWGPFSTAALCSGLPGPFKRARTRLALVMDIFYALMRFGYNETTFKGDVGNTIQNHALGYFIIAKKN